MATYHFTMKNDSHKNGSRIEGRKKIDYIMREGKYKDIDEERMREHDKFLNGLILDSKEKEYINLNQEYLLYESPYGNIKMDQHGKICVTRDASIETMAMALSLSNNIFHDKIAVFGGENDIAKLLVSGKEMDLDIQFAHKQINDSYLKILEADRNERRNDNARFGQGKAGKSNRKNGRKEIPPLTLLESNQTRFTTGKRLDSVPLLSECPMVFNSRTEADLLLHGNEIMGCHVKYRNFKSMTKIFLSSLQK